MLGGRGFSLIPFEGLHAIIFANPRLLLPTKSVVAYARKQSRSTIFEWQEKEKGWYLYASEYPPGWVKKVKVVNLSVLTKKGLMTWNVKPKFAKKGDDSSETCSNIIPYGDGLPPIGNIVFENSPPPPPPSTRTRSSRRSTASKPMPSTPRPSLDAPPSNRTRGNKRKTSPPA